MACETPVGCYAGRLAAQGFTWVSSPRSSEKSGESEGSVSRRDTSRNGFASVFLRAPISVHGTKNDLVRICTRGLNLFVGHGEGQKVSVLIVKTSNGSPIGLQDLLGVVIGVTANKGCQPRRVVSLDKIGIEIAGCVKLRNDCVEFPVPVVSHSHSVIMEDGTAVEHRRSHLSKLQ